MQEVGRVVQGVGELPYLLKGQTPLGVGPVVDDLERGQLVPVFLYELLEVRYHLARLVVVVPRVDNLILAHPVYHLLTPPLDARKRIPQSGRVERRACPLRKSRGGLLYLGLRRVVSAAYLHRVLAMLVRVHGVEQGVGELVRVPVARSVADALAVPL